MNRRKFERLAVLLLSIIMLFTSTGIVSSLAVDAGATSVSSETTSTTSETTTSTKVSQEGGAVTTTTKVQAEGGSVTKTENGDGTSSNPYKISTASEFIAMQSKINLTSNANKYFVLTDDIDLSGVTAAKFKNNSVYEGSLVSVNKSLSNGSKNVFFVLNGQGHKIYGLNVKADTGSLAIFGYINAESQIKNVKFSECSVFATAEDAKFTSLVSAENDGVITGVTVEKSHLNASVGTYTGFISALNKGTISNTIVKGSLTSSGTSTADENTISATGSVGAVTALNRGKITTTSALNVGMYIPEKSEKITVYGGISGKNSGTVANCISTGNAMGGKSNDIAGGIIGQAVEVGDGKAPESNITNSYTLVCITKSVFGNAIIGAAGTADMIKDCYWSSAVSNRHTMATDYGTGINDISALTYKVVNEGKSFDLKASDLGLSWGKASFSVKGGFSGKEINIKLNATENKTTVSGVKADSIAYLVYSTDITLPADVGAGNASLTVSQKLKVAVLVMPKDAKGNGTSESPLEIENASEFNLIYAAPYINCKLTKNITVSLKNSFDFCGTFDGAGHTISTNSQIFSAVYGSEKSGIIKNTKFIVTDDISTAIIGRASNASVSGLTAMMADSAKYQVKGSNKGLLFNIISGACSINDCHTFAEMNIVTDKVKNVGGFAGTVIGNGAVIKNSGSKTNITSDFKDITGIAGFVGNVSAENAVISDCYVSGNVLASKYAFAGTVSSDKIAISNIIWSKGTDEKAANAPVDFKSNKALSEKEFTVWAFTVNASGFFTGNGGVFEAPLTSVKAMSSSSADDFKVKYNNKKIAIGVSVEDGMLVLNVSRAAGVVTVKNSVVTVTNTKTGLVTSISISNGLEKDNKGNYVITSGYDFAYISENSADYTKASFVVASDIDMSVVPQFVPIGSTGEAFSGSLNGNNHTISGLNINGTAKAALFATLDGAKISGIVFDSATVTAESGYAAILAGQAVGKTVISDISVLNSAVTANDNYSALLVASLSKADSNVSISNITIKNSTLSSTASYVASVTGNISGKATVTDIIIDTFKADGASYVAGVVANTAAGTVDIKNINVNAADISGVSEVAGVIACGAIGTTLSNVSIKKSTVSTVGNAMSFVSGGIAAYFASGIDGVIVEDTQVFGGITGGIVGRTSDNTALTIKNVQIKSSSVSADGSGTIAAGILGMHNKKGTVKISNCRILKDTTISGASVSAGFVGDFSSSDGKLFVSESTSFASVSSSDSVNGVVASGVVGRIGMQSINNVSINKVNVAGSVSGNGSLGGIIGKVKGTVAFNSTQAIVSDCVAAVNIIAASSDTQNTAGLIIGSVDSNKALNNANIQSAIKNVVISSFYDDVPAYSSQSGITGGGYYDMDKPNGSNLISSVNTLENSDVTEVALSNLPKQDGFTFDEKTGWVSESSDRIEVVESTQNSVKLKANHKANIAIVSYYVLDTDAEFIVPVHFRMVSNIFIPLNGSGTKESPYIVSNAYELETMAHYADKNAYFALTQDIEFAAADFEFGGAFYNVGNGNITVGNAQGGFHGTFTGLYNGVVHTISGMTINGNVFGGLFGATDGATISDLIINDASIKAQTYAAVLVGSAKDTTIKNITINNSKVSTTQTDSVSGLIVGLGENVTIDNVKVNNADVSTSLSGTSANVEVAGGIAGVFSGSISNVILNNVSVNSGTVSGGVIGKVNESAAKTKTVIKSVGAAISGLTLDVSVNGQIAGGIVGSVYNPTTLSISDTQVSGTVTADKIAGGAIGQITAQSSDLSISTIDKPMLNNLIIACAIKSNDILGVAIGDADVEVFTEAENTATDVFSNVYYSSYTNDIGAFGNNEICSYQNDEYNITDLSNVKFVSGGVKYNTIPMSSDVRTLADSSFSVAGIETGYKTIGVAGRKLNLINIISDVDGLLTYDNVSSTIKLNSELPNKAKLILVYDNGIESAIEMNASQQLNGSGTESDPYIVATAEDFAIMMENNSKGIYYSLANDISLDGISSADSFEGILLGNGHVLYDFTGTALFGVVSGTLSDIGFVGFKISHSKSETVGAVAGVLDAAVVKNCYVIADVADNGNNQDVGVLAGRMINGASVDGCLTSGKVISANATAVGGIIGAVNNSSIINSTSSSYVYGGKSAGGISGDAEYAKINNVVFYNMAESENGFYGNIVGTNIDSTSDISKVYYDFRTGKTTSAVGYGDVGSLESMATEDMLNAKLESMSTLGGYPVSEGLVNTDYSPKFIAGVTFASMEIRYISGLNIGTVYDYTSIKTNETVLASSVNLVKNADGSVVATLMPDGEFTDAINAIERYAVPAKVNTVNVSYIITDSTKDSALKNKVVGLYLKSVTGNAFDLFTRAKDPAKVISAVSLVNGKLYVSADLPKSMQFTVKASDAQGKALEVTDADNAGWIVEVGESIDVNLNITVIDADSSLWGLRSIWNNINN